MSNQEQYHKGEGDNVGRDKIINYNFHFIKKKHIIITTGVSVLLICTFLTYNWLSNQCTTQTKKLRIDIAYFEPGGNHSFTISLKDILRQDLNPFSVNVDGYDQYLLQNTKEKELQKRLNKVITQKCNYKGLIVYGNRDKGEKSFHCWIDVVNIKKDTSLLLREPPIDFSIPEQADYVSEFIKGIAKYYLGENEAALKDLKSFLKAKNSVGQMSKITSICYTYIGVIYARKNNWKAAKKALEKAYKVFPTKVVKSKLALLQNKIHISPTSYSSSDNDNTFLLQKEVSKDQSVLDDNLGNDEVKEGTASNPVRPKKPSEKELMYSFFKKNVRYPVPYLQRFIYKIDSVKVRCLVDAQGNLREIRAIKNKNMPPIFNTEALRVTRLWIKARRSAIITKDTSFVLKVPFSYKYLAGSNFTNTHLRAVMLNNAFLRNIKFNKAFLMVLEAKYSDLKGADFSNADARGIRFDCSDLRNVSFTSANLNSAYFKGALLPTVNKFRTAKVDRGTKFDNAFTEDPKFLRNLKKVIFKSNNFRAFNLTFYKLKKLTIAQIKKLSKYNSFLKGWNTEKPLYQIINIKK